VISQSALPMPLLLSPALPTGTPFRTGTLPADDVASPAGDTPPGECR